MPKREVHTTKTGRSTVERADRIKAKLAGRDVKKSAGKATVSYRGAEAAVGVPGR